jgi:hypothetical protein
VRHTVPFPLTSSKRCPRLLLLCSTINGKYTIFDAKRMILFVYKAKYVAAKNIWHEIRPIRMEAKMDIYALQII